MGIDRIWMALPLLATLAACGGSQDTGTVSVLLTDAPGDFLAAVVTITEVDLVGSDGTTRLLTDRPVTTNLLTLANDTASLVKDVVVPVGTYSQLRFVISGGYVEVAQPGGGSIIYASSPTYAGLPEGATVGGTLQMPSFAQSGLKVNLPAGAQQVTTGANVLLVDFDVAQSFGQQAGNSGSWVMHPVVTATRFELSGTVVATLALGPGVTLPGTATLGGFQASLAKDGSATKQAAFQDPGTGVFTATFPYLIPGPYEVGVAWAGPAGVLSSVVVAPATTVPTTVLSGQPTRVDFVITAATAAGGT